MVVEANRCYTHWFSAYFSRKTIARLTKKRQVDALGLSASRSIFARACFPQTSRVFPFWLLPFSIDLNSLHLPKLIGDGSKPILPGGLFTTAWSHTWLGSFRVATGSRGIIGRPSFGMPSELSSFSPLKWITWGYTPFSDTTISSLHT